MADVNLTFLDFILRISDPGDVAGGKLFRRFCRKNELKKFFNTDIVLHHPNPNTIYKILVEKDDGTGTGNMVPDEDKVEEIQGRRDDIGLDEWPPPPPCLLN